MDILVVGANGGIGLAIVKQLLTALPEANIHATYHRQRPDFTSQRVTWFQLDVTQESDVAMFSQRFSTIDWLINAVGMLHAQDHGPEKNLQALDGDFFMQNIAVNTLPTLLLAKYFSPLMKASTAAKFVTISAKVGSISDNRLGGWYSYRASKAALNMLLKTLSIEWQRTIKQGVVLALHPGTTDTPLSKPFQANVPVDKLLTPQQSAALLVELISQATSQQTGQFLAYNGERLSW